eukprot:12102663-Alexandrium_andersonii.AAC.1
MGLPSILELLRHLQLLDAVIGGPRQHGHLGLGRELVQEVLGRRLRRAGHADILQGAVQPGLRARLHALHPDELRPNTVLNKAQVDHGQLGLGDQRDEGLGAIASLHVEVQHPDDRVGWQLLL